MNNQEKIRLGFALCGSFCTFKRVIAQLEILAKEYDVTPIMSGVSYSTDTRFGKAEDFIAQIEEVCQKKVLHTIKEVEPFGPKGLLDILVVAPCTGNTIAKLANGIADSSVTLAAKAHLRNNRPLVIAVSTNDGLGSNAKNIGQLLNMQHNFFVPFCQDDPIDKEKSLVAIMEKIPDTVAEALKGKQIQPVIS